MVLHFVLIERRIKCDETKPVCNKCSTTGRTCDGYDYPSSLSTIQDDLPYSPVTNPTLLAAVGNERQRRSFSFFCERTIPQLTGYYGSEFWSRLVLQASQHQPAIWHSLVALGSLHEHFEYDQQVPGFWPKRLARDNFAIQEYITAISSLLRPSIHPATGLRIEPSVDVCLISCILFTCFETMSSHFVSAISHIKSGMRILSEIEYDASIGSYRHPSLQTSTVTPEEIEILRSLLCRLHIQVNAMSPVPFQQWRFDISTNIGRDYSEIPTCFSSISECRDFLEHYTYKYTIEAYAISRSEDLSVSEAFAKLRKRYAVISQRWSAALDEFIHQKGEQLTIKERLGLAILNIYRLTHVLSLEVEKPNYEDQTVWDKHSPLFRKIVDLAAFVVEKSHELDPHPSIRPSRPSFSLDMGIVSPLFDVATRCRDPVIRRKAVTILRSACRQEGVFNSYLSALVAERVIQIEENAAGGFRHVQHSVPKPTTDKDGDTVMSRETSSSSSSSLSMAPLQMDSSIKSCHEVPDWARLSYAYPAFDLVERRVFLSIGRRGGMHMNIPLPLMDVMLDMDY